VPTVLHELAQHPDFAATDLSGVRVWGCGGAPTPLSLVHSYADREIRLRQGCGMTETGPTVFLIDAENAVAKAGSVGKPQVLVEVRAVDDRGTNVPPGQPGELLVRGPGVTPGYWERPDATAAAFTSDGWLRSGDVGRCDGDGYWYIVDRVKDVYISGRRKRLPAEVEGVLDGHPAIAEAAVVGVPDDRWGEVGAAAVSAVPPPARRPRRSKPGAGAGWPDTRCPSTSSPLTSCRATRPARYSSRICARSCSHIWEPGLPTAAISTRGNTVTDADLDLADAAPPPRAADGSELLAKGKRTHHRLLEAAEHVFAELGYHDASIVKITEAAGVAHGTFYRYFPSKQAIFDALLDDLNRRVRRAMSEASAGTSSRAETERRGFEAFFRFTAEHPALYQIIRPAEFISPAALHRHYERIAAGYIQGLREAMGSGEIAAADPQVLAWALMGVGEIIGMRWILWGDTSEVPPDVFEEALGLVVRGLGAAEGG
jgi:AcrR family transcriptional regulator